MWAQEEKEHFMIVCYRFINRIVYKEVPLYCIEVFTKTIWNFSE